MGCRWGRWRGLELLNRYSTGHPEDAERVVLSVKSVTKVADRYLAPQGDRKGARRSDEKILRALDGNVFSTRSRAPSSTGPSPSRRPARTSLGSSRLEG